MSFRFPYRARIMGQLTVAGVIHNPVELFRAKRTIQRSDFLFWTAGLTSLNGWKCWIEHLTPEKWLLGGRRNICAPSGSHRDVIKLSPEETQRLEADGLKPEYKATP